MKVPPGGWTYTRDGLTFEGNSLQDLIAKVDEYCDEKDAASTKRETSLAVIGQIAARSGATVESILLFTHLPPEEGDRAASAMLVAQAIEARNKKGSRVSGEAVAESCEKCRHGAYVELDDAAETSISRHLSIATGIADPPTTICTACNTLCVIAHRNTPKVPRPEHAPKSCPLPLPRNAT